MLYLALPDGPGCFRQDFSCLAVLRILLGHIRISCTGLAPSSVGLSMPFHYTFVYHLVVLLPQLKSWFGLFRVRSPLLTESLLFSFPLGTKMFQFPRLLSHTLCIQVWIPSHYGWWVPPFGYRRIVVYVPLPDAFRRLLRPSSAHSAKASTVRPY